MDTDELLDTLSTNLSDGSRHVAFLAPIIAPPGLELSAVAARSLGESTSAARLPAFLVWIDDPETGGPGAFDPTSLRTVMQAAKTIVVWAEGQGVERLQKLIRDEAQHPRVAMVATRQWQVGAWLNVARHHAPSARIVEIS